MTAYLCLLSAVNVGGRKVPSGQLRDLASDLGFTDVATIANSGTLVVTSGTSGVATPSDVAHTLHRAISAQFPFDVPVSAVTGEQLDLIATHNPFRVMADADPAHLLVYVGQGVIDAAGIAALNLAHPGTEQLAIANDVLYVTYPNGVGTSKLTAAALSRAAGTPLTGRNWNSLGRAQQIISNLHLARE